MKTVSSITNMINSKATHAGNSGIEGDGVKLGEELRFGWVSMVGFWMLYGAISGYLSTTTGLGCLRMEYCLFLNYQSQLH